MNSSYFENLTRITDAQSFAFSPENPTGTRGGGTKGNPHEKLNAWRNVDPGETITLVDTDGPGVLESMWFGGVNNWSLILRIYWDGCDYPAVEAPLSAFFAYPFYNNIEDMNGNYPAFSSAAVMVAPCRGMNCYWQMPFLRHCRITLENRNPRHTYSTYYIITGKKCPLPENTAYFHASYRQAMPNPADREYVVIDGIRGKGHFVSISLGVNINGNNGCWVEGEVKMFIDDDQYPSINYTGTEDYFCGSYCFGNDEAMHKYQQYGGLYSGMYAVLGADRTKQYNVQPRHMAYRWHIPDPIHFNESFRMTIQTLRTVLPYGLAPSRDDYVSVAYWYQTLPSAPLAPLPTDLEMNLS